MDSFSDFLEVGDSFSLLPSIFKGGEDDFVCYYGYCYSGSEIEFYTKINLG